MREPVTDLEADLEAVERWRGERLRLVSPTAVDCGLVKASDDFIKGFAPPDYQIDGILQRRFIYSLTAPTGAGKTAIALFLSAAVGGAAKSVAGHAVERGRVLYLAGENPDDIRMRWMAMSDKQGFDLKEIDVRFVAGVIPIPDMFDQIAREVESVSLVVVDTSAAYFSEMTKTTTCRWGNTLACCGGSLLCRASPASLSAAIPPRTPPTTTCCLVAAGHSLQRWTAT
jgi:hypothetical protein